MISLHLAAVSSLLLHTDQREVPNIAPDVTRDTHGNSRILTVHENLARRANGQRCL